MGTTHGYRRLTVALLLTLLMLAAMLAAAPVAQAVTSRAPDPLLPNLVVCQTYPNITIGVGTFAIPWELCLERAQDRGYRGWASFCPLNNTTLAARLHTQLTRNGANKGNSNEFVNPYLPKCPTYGGTQQPFKIATPWSKTAQGTYCVKLWNNRVNNIYDLVGKFCRAI